MRKLRDVVVYFSAFACAAALAAPAWAANSVTERIAGANRISTAVNVGLHCFPSTAKHVYLARQDVFADALAAGALTDGPTLLVPRSGTAPVEVRQAVARMNPESVVALGGEGSVPTAALQDAKRLAEGRAKPDSKPATGQGDPKKLRQISAGGDHTCAVAESGNLYCWGSNRFGQIGIGNASPNYGFNLATDPLPETYHSFTGHNANVGKPALVSTLTNVAEVSSGLTHSCAYDAAGHAFCWGSNVTGQLGQGDTNSRTTPALVPSLTGVTSIAAAGETNGPWSIRKDRADWIPTGTGHSCAVANGTVYCWGDNKWGQLGNGNKISSPTPLAVSGIPQAAKKVVTGETYSCALTNNGDVYCWGTFRHDWGQGTNNQVAGQGYPWLANVSYADSLTPRQVTSVHGATELETGSYYACAKMGNSMHCWGYNSREQFFEDINPATMAPTNGQFPVHRHAQSYTASGWGSIKGFSLGRNSSCAIGPNSRVYCWGLNDAGQVGRSQSAKDNDDSSVRIGIVGSIDTHVKAISVGWAHACAITGDGGARCWGYNPDGQLGNDQVFGARWDSVVFCGLALLAALAWGLDFSALRRRFRGAGTISGVAVSLVVFLLVIIAVSARFLHSTVLGDFFAAVLGRDAAERQSRHDIFMNLLNIPDYFLGVFGLWPLGALEIDLPRVVPFLGFAVCSGVLFLALCQASRRTNLIALVLLLFYVAMPLLLLFEKHATVGVYVQPRYLLPLLTLIVGVWLYPFNRSALMVSVQRWVIGLGTTVSASVALYAVAMRYWRGTQYLPGESTWWWKGVPGPHFWLVMEVLTFGIWAVIILRESRQNQPESAEKDLRTE